MREKSTDRVSVQVTTQMIRLSRMEIVAVMAIANLLLLGGTFGEESVDQIRDQVMAWSESLISFDGVYTLMQYPLGEPATQEQAPIRMRVKYRFQGDDRYIEITDDTVDPQGKGGVLSLVRYGGVVSQRADDEREGVRHPLSGQINGSEWPLPEGAFLTPEELFGFRQGKTLADFLAHGETILAHRDGMSVLSHRADDGNGVDIWLDGSGNVIRLDWVRRLWPTYSDEQIAAVWSGDPFDVRLLLVTLDLGSYKTLNGVNVPTFARKAWWDTIRKKPSGNQSRDRKPSIEGAIASFTEVTRHERAAQTFELQPEDAQVNVRLGAAKFRLEYTDGMLMRDRDSGEDYIHVTPWYRWPAVHLSALAALIGVSIVILVKWRYTRSKRAVRHHHS